MYVLEITNETLTSVNMQIVKMLPSENNGKIKLSSQNLFAKSDLRNVESIDTIISN